MTLSRADVAMLGRRQHRLVKSDGELLAVFVEGKLVNPLNASAWGWQKRSRLAKQWKQRVAMALLEANGDVVRALRHPGAKVVTFSANTHNAMDSDGLQAALKPCRDALVECGVISGDADKDGHVFRYEQKIDRKRRGVELRVSLRQ
jgi:hypothetical protein